MKRHLVIPAMVVATMCSGAITPAFAETSPNAAIVASGPIVQGDTLWKIAKSNGLSVELLESVNPGLNPENLLIGQVVKVPRAWNVSQGNTLFLISHTVGVSMQSIAQLNNISNVDLIYPDQQLLIPEQTATNTASVYPTWTVRSGDTLWNISLTTGVSVNQIAAINAITEDHVPVGRVLLIPPTDKPWTQPSEQVQPPVNDAGGSTQQATQTSTVAKIVLTMPTTSLIVNSNQNYEVHVTALDISGNPVSNVTLNVVGNPWANATQVATDVQGNAMFTVQAGTQPGSFSVGVQDPLSNVSAYASYTVTTGN
ncbi:MAG: hypothetical protein A2201_12055 [Alicyclobacillus sp. RIFOXYA1_FULL_53_8]|nr:MAG: hypothetical protein A2201_12055 [Alicyclobacillus sp. RIFOXYA1_FULL_53_8]